MVFDTPLDLYRKARVSDGMGGSVVTSSLIMKLYSFLTPLPIEVTFENQILEGRELYRLYTENSLPEELTRELSEYSLKTNNETEYRILDYKKLGRTCVLTIERVD